MKDGHWFQPVCRGVTYRAEAGGIITEAYLKGMARVYPREWTAAELRAIADHMDRARSAPSAGEMA